MTPSTGILTLEKLTYFVSPDLGNKDLSTKVALLLITQGNIQTVEQEILPVKVKPDRPMQNFD